MDRSVRRAVGILCAASALAASGCSSTANPGSAPSVTPSSSSTPATRPADPRAAHAVYLVVDRSSNVWMSYPRLYTARAADGLGTPLLPDGVVTDEVEASADGSVIVYDAEPPVPRGTTSVPTRTPTWWWSDSTRTHALTGMPADVRGVAVTGDGRAVLAAVGTMKATTWSVVRIDLATQASQTLCDGCLRARPDIGRTHAAMAISDDGALLATSTWGTDQSSGFYGQGHNTVADEQILAIPGATVRWRSGAGFCAPVTVSEEALVRGCAADDAHPLTLHELTDPLGTSPTDRATGLAAYATGPLAGGWWYATQTGDANGPLTIHQTSALTESSSTVIGRWPGGAQIDVLRLAEVTHIDWAGPVASPS